MRIVFMGTPEFAVPTLEALLQSDDQVIGVVTQPDRPKGRGQILAASPIKRLALREGLSVLQPEKMKDERFLEALRAWQPELIGVAAFGRILPPVILQMPPKGCVNVHASLLPKYRGAGPIQWALINGEHETGITTMLMDEGMDTGPILLQERMVIEPDDTAGSLSDRLAQLGGRLLIETVRRLKAGTITPRPQDPTRATLAPLLNKEDGLINWNAPASQIVNRIRGMTPWPGAYTSAGQERWIIWRAVALDEQTCSQAPGTVLEASRDALIVATGKGRLSITELQPAGGRRLTVAQYMAGHRLSTGYVLGSEPIPGGEPTPATPVGP
jgi:methionyl-tRNA formyltransferase